MAIVFLMIHPNLAITKSLKYNHGFMKWLSHKHYCELQALMYPAHSTHRAKRSITHAEKQMKKIQRLAQLQHEDAVPDFEWLPQHNK